MFRKLKEKWENRRAKKLALLVQGSIDTHIAALIKNSLSTKDVKEHFNEIARRKLTEEFEIFIEHNRHNINNLAYQYVKKVMATHDSEIMDDIVETLLRKQLLITR